MTSVHIVGSHAPAQAAASATDGTDPAAGDLFAVLMAALLPQATAIGAAIGGDLTGAAATTATTTDATAVTADPKAAPGTDASAGALALVDMPAAALHGLETAVSAITADHGPEVIGDGKGKAEAGDGVLDLTAAAPATAAPTTTATPDATNTALLDPTLAATAPADRPVAEVEVEEEAERAEATATASVGASAATPKKAAAPLAETLEASVEDSTIHHVGEPLHQPTVHAAEHAPAETAPVAAPMPHVQLASVIAPLRRGADGEYRLAIRLRPEHLGTVDVDVQLHHGTVELHVRTEHEDARHLLVEHLDDLRNELQKAGLRTGNLDVSDRGQSRQAQGGNNGNGQRSPVNPNPAADGPATPTTTNRDAARPVEDGSVDIDI